MKKTWFVLTLLAVTTSLAAIGPATLALAKPLKIGLLIEYTGLVSREAKSMEAGARQRLDEAGWKVAGRQIELITEDSACDPNVAVAKAKKLATHDQVDVLLGPLWGASVVALASYAKQAGINYAPIIPQSFHVLRSAPQNAVLPMGTLGMNCYPAGLYAYDGLGYRTATIVYSDFIAGQEFIAGFETGFKERGGTIVQRQPVPPGTIDFAPYLNNLKKADCLGYWLAGTMGPFLQQYYQFGLKIPIIPTSNTAITHEELIALGDKPLGIIGSSPCDETVVDLPLNPPFIDAMKKRLGKKSLAGSYLYALGSYMMTTTFLEAVKATGGDTSQKKLMEAWRNVKMDTPMGVISFDKQGCAVGNSYVFQWSKKGADYYWKPIKAYEQVPLRTPDEK